MPADDVRLQSSGGLEAQASGARIAAYLRQFADGRTGATPAYLTALARLCDAQHSLAWWVGRYLAVKVSGGSPNTLAARSRDLTAFIDWFVGHVGHGDIEGWRTLHTQVYLRHMEAAHYAPTSINRALSSLKHFARWAQEQPGAIFAQHGLPTAGVKDLMVDEPDCKKLSADDARALFAAAQRATLETAHPMARPLRNLAMLALLYYTGLRVTELVILRRDQYDGRRLLQVSRKGRSRSRSVYLCRPCRQHLDAYLLRERPQDTRPPQDEDATADTGPLFVSSKSGGHLDRQRIGRVLGRLGEHATAAMGRRVEVHPHRLRHTFGSLYREASGSDAETATALGHAGLKYVGRYTRKSQTEREDLLETMFEVEDEPPA